MVVISTEPALFVAAQLSLLEASERQWWEPMGSIQGTFKKSWSLAMQLTWPLGSLAFRNIFRESRSADSAASGCAVDEVGTKHLLRQPNKSQALEHDSFRMWRASFHRDPEFFPAPPSGPVDRLGLKLNKPPGSRDTLPVP